MSSVILAAGLSACAGLTQPGRAVPATAGTELQARDRAYLAACMLRGADTRWMFDQSAENPLLFHGKRIGLFLGGAQTLRYDVHWFQCMGELAGTQYRVPLRSDGEGPYGGYARAIADLAGLPLYQSRQAAQTDSSEANFYNPALIVWAETNMIPAPNDSVYGLVTYRDIYDRVLRRSARILAKTYVYLRKENRLESFGAEYAAKHGYDRIAMRAQFADVAADEYTNDDYDLNFDAGHAATFWFRRHMDETHDEVWSLVSKAMLMYDPAWFKNL